MPEDLTPAKFNLINEDFISLAHTTDEVAACPNQREPVCTYNHTNIEKLQTWAFNKRKRLLFNNLTIIKLTRTENLILDVLISSAERVISNEEILIQLNKNPDKYKGLLMCLSRLQAKFKKFSEGAPLLRSVRNRGYCLIQRVDSE